MGVTIQHAEIPKSYKPATKKQITGFRRTQMKRNLYNLINTFDRVNNFRYFSEITAEEEILYKVAYDSLDAILKKWDDNSRELGLKPYSSFIVAFQYLSMNHETFYAQDSAPIKARTKNEALKKYLNRIQIADNNPTKDRYKAFTVEEFKKLKEQQLTTAPF